MTQTARRVMLMSDVRRLSDGASKDTHLARYERAFNQNARRVLDSICPYCSARPGRHCAPEAS